MRGSLQRVWTHKPQGELQEQPVPFGTRFNIPIISGWTLKRSGTQSKVTQIAVPYTLDPLLSSCWKAAVAISCMKNTAASTSPLPSTQKSHRNWYTCPPIKLKQNLKMALCYVLLAKETACAVLTLGDNSTPCTRKPRFLLLTDWESSPLPFPDKPDQTLAALYTTLSMHSDSLSS